MMLSFNCLYFAMYAIILGALRVLFGMDND